MEARLFPHPEGVLPTAILLDRADRERCWLLTEARLRTLLLPLVALATGTLLGGALFHLIPAAIDQSGNHLSVYLWVMAGFAVFFGLEQFLNWRHGYRVRSP